jgi:hypothetical protein
MANITTILGTDSVSSSRIVINNNFAALNTDIAEIGDALDPAAGTLQLAGLARVGTLTVLSSSNLETFKVTSINAVAEVPISFNKEVILGDGLMHSVSGNPTAVTSLPAVGEYTKTVYILNASSFPNPTLLGAEPGQQITFIASGGSINFDPSKFQGISSVSIAANGSITVIYIGAIFHIVASQRATIVYS